MKSLSCMFTRKDQSFVRAGFYQVYSSDQIPTTLYPWKIHVFGDYRDDSELDFLYEVLVRSLIDSEISFKVVNRNMIQYLIGTNQEGKFLTIYPSSKEQFKELLVSLDQSLFHLIEDNQLQWKDCEVVGDKEFDCLSGRLFYRYEMNSGKFKDNLFFTDKTPEQGNTLPFREYLENYESNRGQGCYLAEDMTEEDDPLYGIDLEELQYHMVLNKRAQNGEPLNAQETSDYFNSSSILNQLIGKCSYQFH